MSSRTNSNKAPARSCSNDPVSSRRTRSANNQSVVVVAAQSGPAQQQPQFNGSFNQLPPNNNNNCSGNWHRSANERCLVCRRLNNICICDKENGPLAPLQDVAERKAALDAVASATPFARAKAQRMHDKFFDEATRARQQISNDRFREMQQFGESLEHGVQLIALQEQETDARERLLKARRVEVRKIRHRQNFDSKFALLCGDESWVRNNIIEGYFYEFRCIEENADFSHDVASLVSHEELLRSTAAHAEAESRSCVLVATGHMLAKMARQFTRDCDNLEQVYFFVRDEILRECSTSYCELMHALSSGSAAVAEGLRQRQQLLEAVHATLRQLEVQEGLEREELARTFEYDTAEMIALLRLHADERDSLAHEEAFQRSIVRSDECSRFKALVDHEGQHRERAVFLLAQRAQERDAFVEDCLLELRAVRESEDDAREALWQQQEHEHEQTRQLVADKAAGRQRVLAEALRTLRGVAGDEANERSFIAQRMSDAEMSLQLRFETDAAERAALCESELDFRGRVESQRDSDLQAMALTMLECAATVCRIVDSRSAQRTDVAEHEIQLRADIAALEARSRMFVEAERERILNEHLDMLEEQEAARLRLESEAVDDLETVFAECAAIFHEEIAVSFAAELERCAMEQFDREHCELFDAERRFRSKGGLMEYEERRSIAALFAAVQRHCARAAEEAALEALSLLERFESDCRDEIRQEAHDVTAEVMAWSHRSERFAVDAEKRRKADELAVKELDMLEEPPNPQLGMRLSSADMQQQQHQDQQHSMMICSPDPRRMLGGAVAAASSSSSLHPFRNVTNEQQQQHHRHHGGEECGRASYGPASLARAHGVEIGATDGCGRVSFNDVRRSVSVAQTNGERQLKVDYLNRVLGPHCRAETYSDEQIDLAVALLEKSAERRADAMQRRAAAEKKLHELENRLLKAERLEESKRDALLFHRQKKAEEKRRFERTLEAEKEQVQRTKKQVKIEEARLKEMEQRLADKKEANECLRDAIHNKMSGGRR